MNGQSNEISLLNDLIKSLEIQVQTYKRQIATFLQYFYIFDQYDQMANKVHLLQKENKIAVQIIRELEEQIQRLLQRSNQEVTPQHQGQIIMMENHNSTQIHHENNSNVPNCLEDVEQVQNQEVEVVELSQLSPRIKSSFSHNQRLKNDKILNLEKRLAEEKSTILHQKNYIKELRQTCSDLQKENIDLNNALVKKDHTVKLKQNEIEELTQNIQDLESKLYDLNQRVLDKENQIFSKEKAKRSVVFEKDMETKSFEKLIKQKQKDIKTLCQDLQEQKLQVRSLESKLMIIEEQFKNKENSLKMKNKFLQEQLGICSNQRDHQKMMTFLEDSSGNLKDKDFQSLGLIIDTQAKYIAEQNSRIEELKKLENMRINMVESLEESNSTLKRQTISTLTELEKQRKQNMKIRSNNLSFQQLSRNNRRHKSFSTLRRKNNESTSTLLAPTSRVTLKNGRKDLNLNLNFLDDNFDSLDVSTLRSGTDRQRI